MSGPEVIERRTLHEELAHRLRRLIVEAEIEPGARIDERTPCERFGVSRTPLREALEVGCFCIKLRAATPRSRLKQLLAWLLQGAVGVEVEAAARERPDKRLAGREPRAAPPQRGPALRAGGRGCREARARA